MYFEQEKCLILNTIIESIIYDEDSNTLTVKLRPVFEYLRQIKQQKKQEFSATLKNLTGTLENRSQQAKEALKNNVLDLTKITMIGTRKDRLNTKIEPYYEGSKKLNVVGGTVLVARIKRVFGFCFKEFHSFRKSPPHSARSRLNPDRTSFGGVLRPFLSK